MTLTVYPVTLNNLRKVPILKVLITKVYPVLIIFVTAQAWLFWAIAKGLLLVTKIMYKWVEDLHYLDYF